MSAQFEFHLKGASAPEGQLDADHLLAIVASLKEVATKLGRPRPTPNRSAGCTRSPGYPAYVQEVALDAGHYQPLVNGQLQRDWSRPGPGVRPVQTV